MNDDTIYEEISCEEIYTDEEMINLDIVTDGNDNSAYICTSN